MRFGPGRTLPLTVAEIGVFLNMTPGGVRKAISLHGIESAGKRGRAKLYWMHDVVSAIGARDRTPQTRHRRV